MPYGICPNSESRCQFSYRSRELAQLHDLLHLIQAQESLGSKSSDITVLQRFTTYFQTGVACTCCGENLCKALLPMSGFGSDVQEYERRIRLNHLLGVAGELEALGVLVP